MTTQEISKLLLTFNKLVQLAGVVFVGVFIYAIALDRPYLSYPMLPMRVIGSTFHAGDVVPVEVQRCNASSEVKTFMSSRALINVLTQAPTVPTVNLVEAKPGCTAAFINASNRLPIDTAPGIYHYAGRSEVNGLLRTFDVSWVTQDFEVLP